MYVINLSQIKTADTGTEYFDCYLAAGNKVNCANCQLRSRKTSTTRQFGARQQTSYSWSPTAPSDENLKAQNTFEIFIDKRTKISVANEECPPPSDQSANIALIDLPKMYPQQQVYVIALKREYRQNLLH